MRLPLLFVLFVLTFAGFSQTIVVVDSETKKPLEMVSIVGVENNHLVTSNENGEANIDILKGENKIVIQFLGYQNLEFSYSQLAGENKKVLLEPSYFNVGEVVISATKWQQKGQTVPHKITSIPKKSIRFQNPQTSADLLATSGNVFVQKSQQGGGSPMIRGFSTNRLLYSVDGVRMNTAIFRSGNLQNVISLDPFAMDQVEILFGPGAIVYGSDAIGGVMSFNTKRPSVSSDSNFLFSGNADLRFSSANSEVSSHLDLSFGSKKWGLLSSFSRSDFGDLKMGTNGPSDYLRDSLVVRQDNQDFVAANENNLVQAPTNYGQTNLMQKVIYKPSDKIAFIYSFHFSETSPYSRYDRLIQKRDSTFRYSEWNYGPQKWFMHHLEINSLATSNLFDVWKLNFAFQRFEESRIDRNFRSIEKRTRTEKVFAYSTNLDFSKLLGKKHELFYGFESVINTVNSQGQVLNILTQEKEKTQSRYPESQWYSNAFYATDNFKLNDKITLEGGFRLNHFILNSSFDTNFINLPFNEIELNNLSLNGSFGFVYRPTKSWVINSNLSTGFRAPNVDDIGKFDDQRDETVIVPNKGLSAEYAYNVDLGATKVINNFLKVDVTLFYTYLDKALVRRDFQLNSEDSLFFNGETKRVQAIQNAANAYVYGVQAGFEAKLNSVFNLSSQINFQKGEEELEDGSISSSRHAAPLFGISRLTFKKKKFLFQLNVEYSSEISYKNLNVEERDKDYLYAKDKNGLPFSPSWYTVNIKGQYKLTKTLTTNLGLENITNQRYRTYSSGIAAAGRNLVFSLNATF